jgi:hypothetical protein
VAQLIEAIRYKPEGRGFDFRHWNFRASFCPSSGAYQLQQQQPLVYRRTVVVAVLLAPRFYGKPEAAAAVDRLLIMGIRMPETC